MICEARIGTRFQRSYTNLKPSGVVATPIVLKQMKSGEKVHYGRIPASHAAYSAYNVMLRKTLAEQYAAFLTG